MKQLTDICKSFSKKSYKRIINNTKKQLKLLDITEDSIEDINKLNHLQKSLIEDIKTEYQKNNYDFIIRHIANTWFSRLIILRALEQNNFIKQNFSIKEISKNSKSFYDYPDELKTLSYNLFSQKDYANLFYPFDSELIDELFELPNELFEIDNLADNIGIFFESFNSGLKDSIYKDLKKAKKIDTSTLPTVTQFFTPNYIVKYLVQNSIGRLWINHLLVKNTTLNEKELIDKFNLEFYIPTNFDINNYSDDCISYFKNIKLENLTILDPAMGAGVILSYSFDLLLKLYLSEGYNPKEAVTSILENNLFGLEIDIDVFNLSEIVLLLKALQYDPSILNRKIIMHLYCFEDIEPEKIEELNIFTSNLEKSYQNIYRLQLGELIQNFTDAQLIGSLMKVNNYNTNLLKKTINDSDLHSFYLNDEHNFKKLQSQLINVLSISDILSSQFDVVITNPPYFSKRYFNDTLKDFLKANYKDNSKDLYAAFIEQCLNLTKKNSYCALVTMQSWLFLKNNMPLRLKILNESIINMVHLGTNAFDNIKGEVVQTVAFIIQKTKLEEFRSSFLRLTNVENKEMGIKNKLNLSQINTDNFRYLPNTPIAYWISETLIKHFTDQLKIEEIAESKQGLATTDNKRFLRQWTELDFKDISFNNSSIEEALTSQYRWFPYNKGGSFRKWYGNDQFCVDYYNDGIEIKENVLRKYPYLNNPDYVVKNTNFYFKPSITWSLINTDKPSFRIKDQGYIFDVAGMSLFTELNQLYLLGLLNSVVTEKFLEVIAPTVNFQCGDIAQIPVIIDQDKKDRIEELVKENIKLSRNDWDNFELSWNFKQHPLIKESNTIEEAFKNYNQESKERFKKLKDNEEELNKLFIEIYGLENEIKPDVLDTNVSVSKANINREIKSLLSYFVGVLFGRYSLDQKGIVLTNYNLEFDKYQTFKPVENNIIPINSFSKDKDIIDYLKEFLGKIYGSENIENNLRFIAKSLKPNSNKNPEDIIRDYFDMEFARDHKKIYNSKPIYFQLNLNRSNPNCLIYYHRFNEYGFDKILDFINKNIKIIQSDLNNQESNLTTQRLKRKLNCLLDYKKKLQSLDFTTIDLNDGVVNNLRKIQTDRNGDQIKVFK